MSSFDGVIGTSAHWFDVMALDVRVRSRSLACGLDTRESNLDNFRHCLPPFCGSRLHETTMKIICAGHFKTGTKSLAKALEILGYKVWDFDSQLLHHGKVWFDVLVNGAKPDMRSLYENSEEEVDVLVDMPSAFFLEEILEAFPDVKVIHTVRDEDAWVHSMANYLRATKAAMAASIPAGRLLSPTKREIDTTITAYMTASLGTFDPNAQTILRKNYRLHNTHVRAVTHSDKTLVFNVKQGWRPLCEFLSVDVPEEPFPHENKQGALARREVFMRRPAMAALVKKAEREVRDRLIVVFTIATVALVLLFAIFVSFKM